MSQVRARPTAGSGEAVCGGLTAVRAEGSTERAKGPLGNRRAPHWTAVSCPPWSPPPPGTYATFHVFLANTRVQVRMCKQSQADGLTSIPGRTYYWQLLCKTATVCSLVLKWYRLFTWQPVIYNSCYSQNLSHSSKHGDPLGVWAFLFLLPLCLLKKASTQMASPHKDKHVALLQRLPSHAKPKAC